MASQTTFIEDYSFYNQEEYNALIEHKNKFSITVRAQGYPVTNQDDLPLFWIYTAVGICRLRASQALNTTFLVVSQD